MLLREQHIIRLKKTKKFPQHVNYGSAYILLAISFKDNLDFKKKKPTLFQNR